MRYLLNECVSCICSGDIDVHSHYPPLLRTAYMPSLKLLAHTHPPISLPCVGLVWCGRGLGKVKTEGRRVSALKSKALSGPACEGQKRSHSGRGQEHEAEDQVGKVATSGQVNRMGTLQCLQGLRQGGQKCSDGAKGQEGDQHHPWPSETGGRTRVRRELERLQAPPSAPPTRLLPPLPPLGPVKGS